MFDEGIETTQKTTTLESISSESEESAETTSRKPLVRDPVEDQTEAITSRSSTFDGDFETVEKHKVRICLFSLKTQLNLFCILATILICHNCTIDNSIDAITNSKYLRRNRLRCGGSSPWRSFHIQR